MIKIPNHMTGFDFSVVISVSPSFFIYSFNLYFASNKLVLPMVVYQISSYLALFISRLHQSLLF